MLESVLRLFAHPPVSSTDPVYQARTYVDLLHIYEQQYNDAVSSGQYEPYVWPYRSFGVYAVLAYLLLSPSYDRLAVMLRYPVFGFNVFWAVKCIVETRSPAMAVAYGIGLVDAWAILWLSALVIFNDARKDFKRVEIRNLLHLNGRESVGRHSAGQSSSSGRKDAQPRLRPKMQHEMEERQSRGKETAEPSYYWQHLPPNFVERLDWVGDLVSSFRGPGWAHQISSIPKPPQRIMSSLTQDAKPRPRTNKTGTFVYPDSKTLLRHRLFHGILWYLTLDLLKVLMMRDRYFWGMLDAPAPAYLPTIFHTSPVTLKLYRLLFSLLGVEAALRGIFSMDPLFFVGILGPRIIGLRAESWYYPSFYGAMRAVYDDGLAGFWGSWWHQLFRFAFQAPSKWLIKKLQWDPRSGKAQVLATIFAFALSGYLHFSGSLTMWSRTNPLRPFMFFLLQAVGIAIQLSVRKWIKSTGVRFPAMLGGVANGLFSVWWLYLLGPLFADDVAKGGVWLFEPVPFSPLRGLGFGAEDQGWWCWHGRLIWFHRAETWYKSGIAA